MKSPVAIALCWTALGLYALADKIEHRKRFRMFRCFRNTRRIMADLTEIKLSLRRYRIVPIIGPFTDVVGPVAKTPQYQRRHLLGDLIMAVTMTNIQQFEITISPVNSKGQPATLDGVPEWLTDNSDVLSLTPSADGLSCTVFAVGIPGTAKVQVNGDADMGSGVTLITGLLDVTVIQAPAVSIVLNPGAVSDQP